MESPSACDRTTNEPIPNTLAQASELPQSELPTNAKPIDCEQRTDHDAKPRSAFTLLDLRSITFTLDGVETLNAQDATNEQFAALAEVVSEVTNVEEWYLEERRDFLNGLYAFCQARNHPFPFTLGDEEATPTASLPLEGAATGLLQDGERSRTVMATTPESTSEELASTPGCNSASDAQTVPGSVNAQPTTAEETP
jgi:hypothetical protein